MKKVFKLLGKILASSILFITLIYGAFHLWEYTTGGKYVKYLSQHSETIPLESTFSYREINKDIPNNQLILVGEIHGFHEPTKFDVDFFKFLNKNHGVNFYVAEFDYVQASFINSYLKTGNEKTLAKALKKWAVIQGRNNKDYVDKYRALHKYYQEIPEQNKFKFLGIDRIQDLSLFKKFIKDLYPSEYKDSIPKNPNEAIEQLERIYSNNIDTLPILSNLKSNIAYYNEQLGRDEVMFQNFKTYYKQYDLKDKKMYGFLGLGHAFKYRVNGKHPFASLVRKSDLGLEDKILSINLMMNESYMVMKSNQLPEFMRDQGPYTRMEISADNMLFIYIIGIKDFKRMTPKNHKSLIKMDGQNNPYLNSIRLNTTIQLLPVTDKMKMDDKGKPYFHYTLFIRNSDWAEPNQ